jgi:hypothetical protein
MKLDMHIHTKYSPDSNISLRVLKKHCKRYNITPIITDHNEVKGNLNFGCIIQAEEISTAEGHIIGYFLTEKIKPKLSALETIDIIHEQGGLACIPHPFDRLRKNSLNNKEVLKRCDIVETFNARVQKQAYNKLAEHFARKNNKLMTVGTDSHWLSEVGKSYIDIEPFSSVKEFMKNLKNANHFTQPGSMIYPLATKIYKIIKR